MFAWGSRDVASVSAPTAAFTVGTQVGVPTGTSLTNTSGLPAADSSETYVITHPITGASSSRSVSVWSNRRWTSTLTVTPGSGATYLFRNCQFENTSDNWCVEVVDTNGTNDLMQPLVVFDHCTFTGNDTTGKCLLAGYTWIVSCDLSHAEDAWSGLYWSVAKDSNFVASTDGGLDPHQDGLQCAGIGQCVVYHCWCSAGTDSGANSALRLGTEFSAVTGVFIHYCGLDDGGYTLQCRGDSGAGNIGTLSVVGCRWTGSAPNGNAAFGPADFVEVDGPLTWSDNKFIGDGSSIASP